MALQPLALAVAFALAGNGCTSAAPPSDAPKPTPGQAEEPSSPAEPPIGKSPSEPAVGKSPRAEPPKEPASAERGAPPSSVPAATVIREVECPPLDLIASPSDETARKVHAALKVLRRVACHPESFGQTTAEVIAAASVPPDVRLELGRGSAWVELDVPFSPQHVLDILEIEDAKMKLQQGRAPRWVVGTGPDVSPLTPWAGAELIVSVRGRRDTTADGTIREIPTDAKALRNLAIRLPEGTVEFAADPHAATSAARALASLADDPKVLSLDADAAIAQLPTLAERYRLSDYSIGSGDEKRKGFTIRPRRTELGAHALADALKLPDARHDKIRIYDANPNRLSSEGNDDIPWRGLELTIELTRREGGGLGLHGWLIDEILVLPAPKG